ncbi:hypothetical protein [uncultured Brevibacillus sp.]|uniref:hypothetical protein n=1 Tax=uncultured Brevibacillus sp. TaxID=169970 RepID=UPI00259AC135|nr:hypothetical protein [uncultured Brevibacillus sp.]
MELGEPIYDERVMEIQRGITEGKTRDQLAKEFGYKNYKTLDIYMRRKNFSWDRNKQTYIPIQTKRKSESYDWETNVPGKVSTIISLFNNKDENAKSIAKRLGFSDHRELANYMRLKGFQWSSEIENYQKVHGKISDSIELTDVDDIKNDNDLNFNDLTPIKRSHEEQTALEPFIPLLEMLERNKEKLIDLFVPDGGSGKVPRYIVPGIFVTKSVHMANTLDQMVREYSKEKNISQRDIFTVALIDFFQRYGYESQVNSLLGKSTRNFS